MDNQCTSRINLCPWILFLFIFCWLVIFFSCISVENQAGTVQDQPETTATPVPEILKNDPNIDWMENELLSVYDYREKALVRTGEIKNRVSRILEMIENCKGPENMLEPFMFVNTTIAPAEMLYLGHSITPCEYFSRDTEIASYNAGNSLDYIQGILEEVNAAELLVKQSCQYNGMSDQYKSTVKNSLLSFRDTAINESLKFDMLVEDILGFLAGYKECVTG